MVQRMLVWLPLTMMLLSMLMPLHLTAMAVQDLLTVPAPAESKVKERSGLLQALAQAPQDAPLSVYRKGWAYGFMSPGYTNDPETTAIWGLGAGYEWLAAKSLAFRADAGVMVASIAGADWGFPVTLNASYYLRQAPIAQRRWTPFITGGYTRGGFAKSSNMFNVGGGVNQWTQGCCGFRFEVLHHMSRCNNSGIECHRNWYVDARLGFVVEK